MTLGLIGKKCGMTRIFTEDGAIPVTVLEVLPNRITQVKTIENDGYAAIQVTMGSKKASHLTKPEAGHFARANVEPGEYLCEFRLDGEANAANQGDVSLELGAEITVDLFAEGQFVDVSGTSKGKGFAGTIKRHNFHRGRKTHGARSYRRPGSIGSMYPQKIFKGKKMAGQMGYEQVTVQNLSVAFVDAEQGLIAINGAVPGPKKSLVLIKEAN